MKPNSLHLVLVAVTTLSVLGNFHLGAGDSRQVQASEVKPTALEKQVIAKEREALDCLKTGDAKRFADLIADDAILVEADGRANKAEVVKGIENLKLTSYTMDDTKFTPLSATSGLLVYTIHEAGTYSGSDFTKQAYASVIWTKRGERWQCLFSQETEYK